MQRSILDNQFFTSFLLMIIVFFFFFSVSCEKDKTPNPPVNETSTMTDRDGNEYKTVKIGNQWWMAENLKARTYQNGDSVSYEPLANDWQDSTPACCINSSIAYGLLYNGNAINDTRKLAPAGWHIATDDEWKTLEMNLGMTSTSADSIGWRGKNEGDKLKKAYDGVMSVWTVDSENQYSVWPNNESGFTALPGGCRIFNGTPGSPGAQFTGYWWSSTAHNNEIWYRYLDYNNSKVFRFYVDKRYGFGVRCVKD